MKRVYSLLSAILAFVACQQIGIDVDAPEGVEGVPGQDLKEVIITASIADASDKTRTSYNESDGKNYWTPGDKIKVFSAGYSSEFTSINTVPAPIVNFQGMVSFITGSSNEDEDSKYYVWALYPYSAEAAYSEPDGFSRTARITTTYPDVQVGVAGTFGDNLSVMIGRSESLTIPFRGAYSGAFFQVNRDDIVSITLRGLNNEVIAGTATLGLDGNLIPVVHEVTDPKTSVTVTAPNGTFEPGVNYYLITLPDVALPDGYSVTLVRNDGLGGTYEVRANRPLNRIRFRNLADPVDVRIENEANIANGTSTGWIAVSPEGDLDPNAVISFADPTVKAICVSKWDTDSDGELSYAEAAAVTTIPYNVFSSNTNITSFDEFRYFTGVTSLGYDTDYDEGTDYFGAFSGCTNLRSITLPPTLTTIAWGLFRGCSSLEELFIPKSVTKIQQVAFLGCSSLEIHMESETPCTLQGDGTYLGGDPCAFGFLYNIDVKAIYVPDEDAATAYKAAEFWPASRIHPEGWVDPSEIISFQDEIVEMYCIDRWDTNQDGKLSKGEAAAVTEIGTLFKGVEISYFDEFKYFTGVSSLPNEAFKNCSYLQSMSFPPQLQGIGTNAFSGCTRLSKITVPSIDLWINVISPVKPFSIPGELYVNGSLVTHITIPDGASYVSDYLCYNLYRIESVTIPDSVNSIGTGAFNNCSSLENVNIPNGVTSIGGQAFSGCSSLEEIVLSDNVVSIGAEAFMGCSGLTEFYIPEGVTVINSGTFKNCVGLTNVTIPDGVIEIGSMAFNGCSGLTDITIPDGVTIINMYTFMGCGNLKSINIPDEVSIIKSQAFSDCVSLESIVFPDNLETIEGKAFSGCTSLKEVRIPDSVTTLISGRNYYYGAFFESGVEKVECNVSLLAFSGLVASNISKLGAAFSYTYTDGGSYATVKASCRSQVKEVVIKKSTVTYTLPSYALADFTGMESVSLPSGITGIGNGAFKSCSSLTSIPIGTTVKYIGNDAFRACSAITSMELPDCLETIGSGAFAWCSGISNIRIPDLVTRIEASTFEECSGLTSIDLPSSLTYIGQGAFSRCISLVEIELPTSVVTIGDNAFQYCVSLATIDIPSSVTSIGKEFFYCCVGLNSISLHDGLVSIGKSAFVGCRNLMSVIIPASVESIGDNAFGNGSIIFTNVQGVGSVGGRCSSLQYVSVLSSTPSTLGKDVFSYSNDCPIYVPAGRVDTYKSADGWSAYADRIQVDPSQVVQLQGISLTPSMTMANGTSATLTPTFTPSNATNTSVSWSSSNTSVATVDAQGNVAAVGNGTATITVTTADGGFTATCEVTVNNSGRAFPEAGAFDEAAYITYVANHQGWFIISQDATYKYDTYFQGVSGTRVEMKFQVPSFSTWGSNKAILGSCDDGSGNGLGCDASNVYYWTRRKYREDGEYNVEYTYTNLVDGGIDGTGVIVLSAEFNGNQITTSVNGTQKTISSSLTSFDLSYLFSSYYYEHDDGSLYEYSAGVPDGTKLYYVKIWNGDQLVYNGYAGRATNPSNSTEEYCWYANVNGTLTTKFAYDNTNYPSNYTALDVYNPVRQPFGGGID